MTKLENSTKLFQINLIQDDSHINKNHDNVEVSPDLYTDLFFHCLESTLKDNFIPFKCESERLSFQSKDGLQLWNITNADDGQIQVSCMETFLIGFVPLYENSKLISPLEVSHQVNALINSGNLNKASPNMFDFMWKVSYELIQEIKLKQLDQQKEQHKHVSSTGIVLKNGLRFK
ncbi:hypothetical protein [Sporolactobacillus laevolacticus]|uniref:hypothetical protein n=1 Tax=Sporolactobacillus laevolacticus TaxID=33018 RepID=UPI0025B34372|nr:hypothetical protein [Sporolactobacillus laevolacticus]MDN3956212.1 hypothetical protein [Sporolactobacillus laevolacticus]